MTWSYSGDPSASTLDEVRYLSGTTDTTDQLVSNEEIAYVISKQPQPELAAALIAESLAAKFARDAADRSVGDVSISLSQRSDAFRKLAEDLRSKAGAYALPIFGGTTISGKETIDEDTDAVQPSFRIGQDDNPEIGSERNYPPTWGQD